MKKVENLTKQTRQYIPLLTLITLVVITSFFAVIFNNFTPISKATNTYNYIGNITHYILNPLIAFPNTFTKNNLNKDKNFNYIEFESLLNQLYKDNFILINLSQITPKNIQDNKVKLTLPQNKKPLLLSFKNLDYSNKNIGFIDKYIIDRNNKISTYTKQEYIHERVSYTNDFIPLLENFIKNHPDFSHQNARANLIVNGSNGFLGYNIEHTFEHYKYELKEVSKVTKQLRKLGYHFIYGGYDSSLNNHDCTKITIENDFNFYKKHLSKVIEKNNYLYTSHQNLKHFKEILKQNFITIIEDENFNTFKEDNLVIITAKLLTPKNLKLNLKQNS